MVWTKKGLVFVPNQALEWSKTHAHVVCVDTEYENFIRVYYSARDAQGRCQASFVDLDSNDFSKVVYAHENKILELGVPGMFDDCGIMPTWLLNHEGEKRLYYIGWNVRNTIAYHNSIGLAVSKDGVNFKKAFEGPLIERTPTEPQFNGSACILFVKGIFKVWYLNCTHWHKAQDGKLEPCYHIKYAESADGIYWDRKGHVAIDYTEKVGGGISRPSVIIEDGIYKMWYSFRAAEDYRKNTANSYRIGYAESPDGIHWLRKDNEVGIDISVEGWDSEMIEYPMVFNYKGQKHMFYNGNGFGKDGFGHAILEN
jgi:predicted GH43/DUF377 family glycosyl hydrolase